jgi:hypothetical protein
VSIFILTQLVAALRFSHGPAGLVVWVQPPHISAGLALIHWHLSAWLEWQS